MRYIPLGGAGEVGATCNLLELDGHRILIDAGIRMRSGRLEDGGPLDRLPDLAVLNENGPVEAILVSHAHMDHIGTLPLVHRAFPEVPIYATPATIELMRVLLADAVRVMAQRAELETDCPLYDGELVTRLLDRTIPIRGPFTCCAGAVRVVPWPAGHVLGAVMFGLEGREGRVLFTNDVLLSAQRTIPAGSVPRFQPDLMVMESTYGNRLHANRQVEERRLARSVAEVIERGGHVLIPAFALGRAQEVLLILRAHQAAGLIPPFPIWVDGMVRHVCQVYRRFPELLTGPLRHMIQSGGDPFYSDLGPIRPVRTPGDREAILNGPPACVIASSGMLAGGPSQYYALRLASDPRHAIYLCGYQDEESPGRKLLDLIGDPDARLELDGQSIPVRCRIDRYGLSAHADMNALINLAASLSPKHVALVHGEPEACSHLASALRGEVAQREVGILLPENGEAMEFRYRRKSIPAPNAMSADTEAAVTSLQRHARAPVGLAAEGPVQAQSTRDSHGEPLGFGGLGEGQPLDEAGLQRLWKAILRSRHRERAFTPDELAVLWYGTAVPPMALEQLEGLLQKTPFFASSARHPGLYRARRRDDVEVARKRQELMAQAGALPGSLVLLRDGEALRAAICWGLDAEGICATIGGSDRCVWSVEAVVAWVGPAPAPLATQTDTALLQRTVFDLVTAAGNWLAGRNPRDLIRVLPDAEQPPISLDDVLQRLNVPVVTDPAVRLAVSWALHSLPDVKVVRTSLLATAYGRRVTEESASGPSLADPSAMMARMEQNAARELVKTRFEGVAEDPADIPYRIGLKVAEGTMVLSFYFPVVAARRWGELLHELQARTGWHIKLNPESHLGQLMATADRVLPPGWRLTGTPSVYREEQRVEVTCICPTGTEASELEEIGRQFWERTGWCLVVNGQLATRSLPAAPASAAAPFAAERQRPTTEEGADQDSYGQTLPPDQRWEVNRAYGRIMGEFDGQNRARIYRCGLKQDGTSGAGYIEVRFISPQVGRRYGELLAQLAEEIGWRIRLYPYSNQTEIQRRVEELLPAHWRLIKSPSVHQDRAEVHLHLAKPPESSDPNWQTFAEAVEASTGYRPVAVPSGKS